MQGWLCIWKCELRRKWMFIWLTSVSYNTNLERYIYFEDHISYYMGNCAIFVYKTLFVWINVGLGTGMKGQTHEYTHTKMNVLMWM